MSKDRATCWSVTVNNPTPQDEENIALARQKGWKVDGQLEKGQQGTLHYQLMVRTPQVRFSAVKKAFPRAHIEIARNPSALATYVEKSDTAVAPLSSQSWRYPSISKYWELIWSEIEEDPALLNNVSKTGIIYKDCQVSTLITASAKLIRKGYFVEHLACNPLIIAQWKNFHYAIRDRISSHPPVDRQTDSREELFSQAVIIPTHAIEETSPLPPPSTPPSREEDSDGSSDEESE